MEIPPRLELPVPDLSSMRRAQKHWARSKWADREKLLRRFRAIVAENAGQLARLMPSSLARTYADTLSAEVLPLLDACKFLQREAEEILRPQRLGSLRRPLWLHGIHTEVHRDALGIVLVIAPSNYPLFLPGVQALQALAAGNACIWKPAAGCESVAHAMRQSFLDAGLAPELLSVTDSSVAMAKALLCAPVDKVFLTGSALTGQDVLRQLAESITPAVMELSGCDAVFVLPKADLATVTRALAFGTRLNGGATCMAPRRIFVPHPVTADLESNLVAALRTVPAVALNAKARRLLDDLIEDAQRKGAHLVLDGRGADDVAGPVVLTAANESMLIAQTDIFAPVLALMPCKNLEDALRMYGACPFALTAAIFGPEPEAREFANQIVAGTVILNDLIAPTVDPRVPFGGRQASGYGVTRGREGLLEMTTPKVILTRRTGNCLHYQSTTGSHFDFFAGVIRGMHGKGWRTRVRGWIAALRTGARIKKAEQIPPGKQKR